MPQGPTAIPQGCRLFVVQVRAGRTDAMDEVSRVLMKNGTSTKRPPTP